MALRRVAPDAERVDVGGDPFAYSRLLRCLWDAGESFLIVEHDIEASDEAYGEALHCGCWWSVSPYEGAGGPLTAALGFTRFRSELLAEFPEAMMRANSIDDAGSVCPPGHWKRLDGRLLAVLRQAGYKPHLHSAVLHHHWYQNIGCACGQEHD